MSSSRKFDKNTTALQVVEGIDLTGYEAIVTGGNQGIGLETVRALAKAGARCIMCARNIEQAKVIAQELVNSTGNQNIEVEKLELDSLQSVDEFVKRFNSKKRFLNILINNAGVMINQLEYTKDGFEKQFAINHMGNFALTMGLLPALVAGAKAKPFKSRVINLSSLMHAYANTNFDDINYKKRPYCKWEAYAASKGDAVLFSIGLNNRYNNQGVTSFAVMPGAIRTNLFAKNSGEDSLDGIKKMGWLDENGKINLEEKSVEAGAATSVWAATAPELENKGGLYLQDCAIVGQVDSKTVLGKQYGHTAFVVDENNVNKLWEISEKLLENRGPN